MESNFVDYVKIYCRSGKGGRALTVAPTVVMAGRVVALSCVVTITIGRFCI